MRVTEFDLLRAALWARAEGGRRLEEAQGRLLLLKRSIPADRLRRALLSEVEISAARRWRRNAEEALTLLNAMDSALSSATEGLTRAREIAIMAASGVKGLDERLAMLEEVGSIFEEVVRVANSKAQGRYLFSGDSNTKPFEVEGKGVRYVGGREPGFLPGAGGEEIAVFLPGEEVFGPMFSALNLLREAIETGSREEAEEALSALDRALSNAVVARARVGRLTNYMEGVRERAEGRIALAEGAKGEALEGDFVENAVRYNSALVSFYASLLALKGAAEVAMEILGKLGGASV